MQHEKLTKQIIGCAYRVYNTMGFGFLESVYEKCMMIELKKAGLKAESQRPITVYYEDEVVGEFVADLVVEEEVIVELKSVRRVVQAHEVQFVNYHCRYQDWRGVAAEFRRAEGRSQTQGTNAQLIDHLNAQFFRQSNRIEMNS